MDFTGVILFLTAWLMLFCALTSHQRRDMVWASNYGIACIGVTVLLIRFMIERSLAIAR